MSAPRAEDTVVITGIGLVTPLGLNRESTWAALRAGEQAGVTLNPSSLGAAWAGMDSSAMWRGCPVDRTWDLSCEPIIGDALQAAREALQQAGIVPDSPERWGCVVGASKGGMHYAVPTFASQRALSQRVLTATHGKDDMTPGHEPDDAWWPPAAADNWLQIWPDAPSIAIAREFNIRGPVLAPAAACATGLVSLIRAADLIREGVCDVVVCGSSDASLLPSLLASYRRLGVMALRGEPQAACQPFDRNRQGFLVGEGAAVMVVESLSHARRRGVAPLAEFVAGRTFSDGAGVAGLDESADGLSRAIDGVTQSAGLSITDVDLVNLHGTGTEQNDRTEVTAMARALAGRSMRGVCCAFKGSFGHLMGAAGSAEAALATLCIRDQVAPPTVNLLEYDPDLAAIASLPMTGGVETSRQIETVLKTSLGFGGPVAAVLFRRVAY